MHENIQVIGIATGIGARNHGCADGPAELRTLNILRDLAGPNTRFAWDDLICPNNEDTRSPLEIVADVARLLADQVSGSLRHGDFPLVIGGDHSCAVGTWSGVKHFLDERQRLGLIWIDAHMDSHTPRTSPTQAIHGMPLACLLGHGESPLMSISPVRPVLHPEDVCLIGVRSFEWREAHLLMNLGVRVYYIDEVRRRGCASIMAEAVEKVSRNTGGYGISIDLDALDPDEHPGVGSPVPNGIHLDDMISGLACLHGDSRLRAIEIVEYNPHLDRNHATANAVHDLVRTLLTESECRDEAVGS